VKRPSTAPSRSGPAMDAKAAAAYCSIKPSTLAKYRQRGTGPRYSTALGRDPRYHKDDLDAWLWGDMAGNSVEAAHQRTHRRAGRRGPTTQD
jgi:Helix-turn-helix domain